MATILEEYIANHPGSAQRYAEATGIFPGGVTHDNRYAEPFPLYVTPSGNGRWSGNHCVGRRWGVLWPGPICHS